MTEDDARWAEAQLERVRSSVEPKPADLARSLELIERRVSGLSTPPSRASAGDASAATNMRDVARVASPSGLALRFLPRVGVLGRLGAADATTAGLAALQRVSSSRLGLLGAAAGVAVFGFAAGVVGYYWGLSDGQQTREMSAATTPRSNTPPVQDAQPPEPRTLPASSSSLAVETGHVGAGPLEPAPSGPPGSELSARTDGASHDRDATDRSRGDEVSRDRAATERSHGGGATGRSSARRWRGAPRPVARRLDPAASPSAGASDRFLLRQAIELLERAEAALRRSDGLEARRLLSEIDQRTTPDLLLEERLVTRALAACQLGDDAEARRALELLEQSNASSIYRTRLEGSCALATVWDRPSPADEKKR
jgi:hypothetical protein